MLKLKDFRPYKREVYYYETDKMGIVHHSNYIRIFEETRIDFLRQVGSPFETIEAKGLMMPVLSVECQYRHPLRFGDEFAVYAEIIKFNGTTQFSPTMSACLPRRNKNFRHVTDLRLI